MVYIDIFLMYVMGLFIVFIIILWVCEIIIEDRLNKLIMIFKEILVKCLEIFCMYRIFRIVIYLLWYDVVYILIVIVGYLL